MNGIEIGQLARAVAALRPDWPAASLRTFLANRIGDDLAPGTGEEAGELAARTYDEVALALVWVALRTETTTPRLVLEPGPWWTVPANSGSDQAERWEPLRAEDECAEHPGQHQATCRSCAADRIAADGPSDPGATRLERSPEQRQAVAKGVGRVRAAIRQARQQADRPAQPEENPAENGAGAALPASRRAGRVRSHTGARGASWPDSGALGAFGAAMVTP